MNLPPRPEFRLHVGWRTINTAFTAAVSPLSFRGVEVPWAWM